MKQSSSAACSKEFAVCSAAAFSGVGSRWMWAHRARDMPPVLGVVAVAAYAAKSVQSGASKRMHSRRAREPSTARAVAGTATRA